jgi:hypothetical protein
VRVWRSVLSLHPIIRAFSEGIGAPTVSLCAMLTDSLSSFQPQGAVAGWNPDTGTNPNRIPWLGKLDGNVSANLDPTAIATTPNWAAGPMQSRQRLKPKPRAS